MNIVKCDFKRFYEEKENRDIIVFGAGVDSLELFNILHKEHRIMFFVDNSVEKHGTKICINDNEFDVCAVEELKQEKYREKIILIGSGIYEKDMLFQLEGMGISNECYLISDIMDRNYCTIRYYVIDVLNADYRKKEEILDMIEKVIDCKEGNMPFCVPRYNFSVTERCTLNCKHCRALIPYMENPSDISFEDLRDEIDILVNNVDIIGSCELIGGETLLYPYLAEAIEYLASFEKVNCIRITTNCTVIPNEKLLAALKNDKVILQLSDYGLLEKMAKLVKVLEKNNIRFRIEKYEQWEDCGTGEFEGKTMEEMKSKFTVCKFRGRCCVNNLLFVENGKVWACGRSSRVARLGKKCPNDYREISKNDTKEEVQKKLDEIFSVEFIQACNYCGQGEQVVKTVKPAIQLTGNLESSAYTIVNREEYNKLLRAKK